MVADTQRLSFDVLREIAYTSLTSSFQEIGSAVKPPFCISKVGNTTNSDIDISFDGVNIHDRLPPNSFTLYDWTAAHTSPGLSFVAGNQGFWVRLKSGTASPTGGYVYITVIADFTVN